MRKGKQIKVLRARLEKTESERFNAEAIAAHRSSDLREENLKNGLITKLAKLIAITAGAKGVVQLEFIEHSMNRDYVNAVGLRGEVTGTFQTSYVTIRLHGSNAYLNQIKNLLLGKASS